MTSKEACASAMQILRSGLLPPSDNDLNVLFELATGRKRYDITHDVTDDEFERLLSLAGRRASGEPLQYICGTWPFLDFEVKVDRRALIPRPETEILAETAISLLENIPSPAVLDLCSGTGVLALSVKRARPDAEVTAAELSEDALSLLAENAEKLRLDIALKRADAFSFSGELKEASLDMIVCNPPYITPSDYSSNYDELKEEPVMAFLGGEDGLDFYRYIIPNYRKALKKGGIMAFEIGNEQAEAVTSLFKASGYSSITVIKDYSSLDRVVYAIVD